MVETSIDPREELIQRLIKENEELRRAAVRDTVTGLYGRRHFDERLEHEWLRAERFWTPLSLIAMDLAGIDELHQRAALQGGDGAARVRQLLSWCGEMLLRCCRDVDIPCRVGRMSFAIILPATNRTGAEAEIARLRELTSAFRGIDLSFGLAVAFDEAQTPLELLMLADESALLDKRGRIGEGVPTEPSPPTWIGVA